MPGVRIDAPAVLMVRRTWLGLALLTATLLAWQSVTPPITAQAQPSPPTVDWSQVPTPSAVADVGVGPEGEVWITTTDQKLYQMNGSSFSAVAGPTTSPSAYRPADVGAVVRVAVGQNGVPWITNQNGDGFGYLNNTWVNMPNGNAQGAVDVGASPNGAVWFAHLGLGVTSSLNADALEFVPPYNGDYSKSLATLNAVRIAVDPTGGAWVVALGNFQPLGNGQAPSFAFHDGAIFRQTGDTLTQIPGQARDIGVGANGAVWIAYPDGVSLFNGTGWTKIAGPPGMSSAPGGSISVAPDGAPWVVTAQGQLWKGVVQDSATAASQTNGTPTPATDVPMPTPIPVATALPAVQDEPVPTDNSGD